MKRNKRTVILAHEDLNPLTEHILAGMGREGNIIRRRLKNFYRERARNRELSLHPETEAPALESSAA
ncbi:MAG: hypothetical protein K6T55_05330 [Syntrophobacterales bacterium]|nr:hypothetical protein [Syntrophobacterales bacterium]